jgi:hypothetical protein
MRVLFLVLAVNLCPIRSALAWGATGHRIICDLAFQELTDTARQRVKQLIMLDHEFPRFSDAARGRTTQGSAPTNITSTCRVTPSGSAPTSAPWPIAVTSQRSISTLRCYRHQPPVTGTGSTH